MYNNYKFLFLSILGLIMTSATAQDIKWEKSFGGKHADYLLDAIPTADYGFILAGSSLSNKTGNKSDNNLGDLDYCIWKMDEDGELEWQKTFGGNGMDMLQSIKNTNDGGFILAGTSNSGNESKNKIRNDKTESSRGGDDFWIIKLDANGEIKWQKTIGGSGQEKMRNICQTKDGGYIIGGSSSSNASPLAAIGGQQNRGEKKQDSYGNLDYWIVKLDKEGKIEWQKTMGGIYVDELRSLEQTTDNGFIVGGYSNSPTSGNKTEDNIGIGDYWVVKLDKKGEIEWQKTIGGNKNDQLYVVHQTYDKGYIIGGNSNSEVGSIKKKSNANGTDFWVLKLDEEGNIIWQETYDIGSLDALASIVENADHSFLLAGYAKSEVVESSKREDEGINDYTAIKITENGEEIWRKSIGSSGEDQLKKVIETRDGGYVFAGTSNPAKASNGGIKSASSLNKGNGSINNPLEEQTAELKEEVKEFKEKADNFYKEQANNITDKVSDAVELDKDSPLKFGISSPLSNNSSEGSDALSGVGSGKLPPSRDKKTNFGSNDFWVVKLKDDSKPKVVKATIEAIPNPATTFTNVIIGYEFASGTATVVDMGGRVLQQFNISSRTVPVDLSSYPEGIYVINIKTDVQSDGVKVMKGINRK